MQDPAPGGDSRTRVLAAIQRTDAPLDVRQIAADVGLHVNTTRFHLDRLVADGLARRVDEERSTPGRPRALYAAAPDAAAAGPRSYQLLAEMLAGLVAAESAAPAEAGLKVGESWGKYLATGPRPSDRPELSAALEELLRVLEDLGFDSQLDDPRTPRELAIRHCPFREVAERHRFVCAIHQGVMRGVLAEHRVPLDVQVLTPFLQPNLCIARFAEGDPR